MATKICVLAYHAENEALATELVAHLSHASIPYQLIAIRDQIGEQSLASQLMAFDHATVLFLISDNFIKSANCMQDCLAMLQKNPEEHIIVIADGSKVDESGSKILVPTAFEKIKNVIEYLNYWQNIYLDLRKQKLDRTNPLGLEKIKLIASEVGDVLRYLRSVEHYPYEQINNSNGAILLKLLQQTGITPGEADLAKSTIAKNTALASEDEDFDEDNLDDIPGWDLLQSRVYDNTDVNDRPENASYTNTEEQPPVDLAVEETYIKESKIPETEPFERKTAPNATLKFNNRVLDGAFQDAESGNLAKAILDIETYLATQPEDVSVRYHYALLIAKFQNDLQGAKQQLEAVLQFDKFNLKSYFLLGELAEIGKDYKSAIENYEKVTLLDPHFPEIQLKLGKLYYYQTRGNQKKAVKHLKKAILQNPDDAAVYYLLGIIQYEHFGKHKKAIGLLHQTIALNPKHLFANYDLANIYLDLNEYELAEKYYLKAIIHNQELKTLDNDNVFSAYKTSKFYRKPSYKGTILITGATSGIGKATANLFAKNGYKLILTGRRKEKLDIMRLELESNYDCKVLKLPFDVTSTEQIDQALATLPEDWRNIDILLNNAGKAKGLDAIQDGNWEHWQEMIDTNIKGLLYMTRKIAPGMVEKKQGHIINICSSAGKEVYANGAVYCATKHAVDALTKGMRLDLYKHNIRVSQVSPGHVEETEFAVTRFDGDTEKAKIYQDFQPLKSSDVAEAILYIVSQPAHVNVQDVVLFCTQQANSTNINRTGRSN